MIDLFVDDDVIYAGVPRLFTRPLRHDGAGGLLARGRRAGRARSCPAPSPTGPLARALDKVARGPRRCRPCCGSTSPPCRSSTRPARRSTGSSRLAVTYFVANRGERTERVIDPLAVVGDRGHWYLQAVDHTRGRGALVPRRPHRGAAGDGRAGHDRPSAGQRGRRTGWPQFADAAVARLRITPGRRRGSPSATRSSSTTPDGRRPGGSSCPCCPRRWLERLLLRLGPRRRCSTRRSCATSAPRRRPGCWPATAERRESGRRRRDGRRPGRRGAGEVRREPATVGDAGLGEEEREQAAVAAASAAASWARMRGTL